jgi:hypothetical protein
LAVNDGDPADLAKKIAAGQGLTANLVLDPNGRISGAYGVRAWPTTVYVNTLGVITRIQSGREPAAQHT